MEGANPPSPSRRRRQRPSEKRPVTNSRNDGTPAPPSQPTTTTTKTTAAAVSGQRNTTATTSIPPTPSSSPSSSTTLRNRSSSWRTHMGLEISVEEQAEQLAHRLLSATDILLDKLFAYLSQLPEEEDDEDDDDELKESRNSNGGAGGGGGGGGMTLPASALGWISSQYFPPYNNNEDVCCPTVWTSVAMKDRLRLLRFLLPRVTHLRITRQVWPPDLPKPQRKHHRFNRSRRTNIDNDNGNDITPTNNSNNRRPRPMDELNCSGMSVSSAMTVEETTTGTSSSATNGGGGSPTPETFWKFMHSLQNSPSIDLRVFPRLQVLVLESIPPTWILHLTSLHISLQVLRWNRASLYGYLPRLFISQQGVPESSAMPIVGTDDTTLLVSAPPTPLSKASTKPKQQLQRHVVFGRLTHLHLDYCSIGERSKLRQTLAACLPSLECVSLAHNGLVTEQTALHGLGQATSLTKLNLNYNQLTALPRAYLYLGGQLQRLELSYNQIETVAGIDRLYALEELWLDHNCLGGDLSELAKLCQLPQLRVLDLQGNRPLEQDHPYYLKHIWSWFQQYRSASTPKELPICNGRTITIEQWNILVLELIPMAEAGGNVTLPARYRKVQRANNGTASKQRQRARIQGTRLWQSEAMMASNLKMVSTTKALPKQAGRGRPQRQRKKKPSKRHEEVDTKQPAKEERPVLFSIDDVLVSLHNVPTPEEAEDEDDKVAAKSGNAREIFANDAKNLELDPFPPLADLEDDENMPTFPLGDHKVVEIDDDDDDDEVEDTAEMTASTVSIKDEDAVVAAMDQEAVSISNNNSKSTEGNSMQDPRSSAGDTPRHTNGGKSKAVTLDLQTGANIMFDVMTADWDDLVQKVAGGLIPDGKPRMPLPVLTPVNGGGDGAFPSEAADLLSPEPNDVSRLAPRISSTSVESASEEAGEEQSAISSMGFRSNALPEQIYPDDYSVPSSLGTNRDDFPSRASKFQIAEENAAYDGPETFSQRNVLDNLKLYFETYVFPPSLPGSGDNDDDVDDEEDFGDDWQTVALKYPRIQLWPEDRRWIDSTSPSNTPGSPSDLDGWSMRNRERFIKVWDEEIVPCGKPALRRLAPNRRNRLGFHGDQLYTSIGPDPYAECRKVYLCLSSAAFYIILRTDDVTKRQEEKGIKKRFPNPIPDTSKFEDAPWPHAIARHTFQELQSITIGFEFQRLILQFSNPTVRKSDPYVYVLLTSNKKTTVSLLQEIQHLTKEAKPETIDLNSDAAAITIENDSQLVLDSLQTAIAPEILGTIIHYQIVQQRWKHGEGRGTVRRVCVVTDTKLFLMDEDYHADSHKALDPPATGVAAKRKKDKVNLANASYRRVDEALLTQVAEVQAAGADPNAITIVIAPLSRLSRTHRWRLVCRDNVGAERLVDDVRKAMALAG